MNSVPFTHSPHEQVQGSVQVVEGLDGLPDDEVAFLGLTFDVDFGDFHADVVGPKVKFLSVFNKACFYGDVLHALMERLGLCRYCGFGCYAQFCLGLVCDVLVFEDECVVAAGLELSD